LLYLAHLSDRDVSLLDCFDHAHLNDGLVAGGDLALLVVPGRLDAVGPWAFQAGILFVAVVISSVVDFDDFEVCLLAVLLQSVDAPVLLEVEEELYVRGTFSPLLQLTCHVYSLGLGVPGLEVILRGHGRIV